MFRWKVAWLNAVSIHDDQQTGTFTATREEIYIGSTGRISTLWVAIWKKARVGAGRYRISLD